jgi:hypothetical protein
MGPNGIRRSGRLATVMAGLLIVWGGELAMGFDALAVQYETQEEKEANLKKQALGDLFQKWTFDADTVNRSPAGFVVVTLGGDEEQGGWVVQADASAPTPPNVVVASSRCATPTCHRLLLAKGLNYEYPDLSIRFRAAGGPSAIGGVVFGAKDPMNFYAAVVDVPGLTAQVVRVVDGKETVLAQTPIQLKAVDWHTLRVQRNTIISKDFIETFVDGTLVLSVEDQMLGLGQVGLLVRGNSALLFDTFHAVPLFSHRPLSPPAAY